MNKTLRFALAAAVLIVTGPAWSAGAQDETAAAALFQEAKQLAGAGDFERACPKFVEAQRLFPTTGTLLNIGNCYEKVDKLASAWGAFKAAEVSARVAGDSGREGEAARRAELLALQLAHLTVVVPPAARVKGFEVHRDGSAVGDGQWGSSLPSDVGFHTIEASAPGRKAWSTTIRIDTNGSAATIEIPPLDKIEVAMDKPKPNGVQKTAGIVVLSAGAAGLTMGAVAGGITAAEHSNLIAVCPTAVCPTSLQSNVDTYHRTAAVSTGAFIAGGIVAATGIVVMVTAPKDQAVIVSPIVGLGFVGARGKF